jgi:hypothetical protein
MLKLTSSRGNKNATKYMPKVFMNVLFYTSRNGIGNPSKETIQAIVKARRLCVVL